MAKITLDDETTAALTLFNEYVAADRERTAREKRLKKAERAKDEAAALVKQLSKKGASAERSEAEAAYRTAAEKWQALRDGKEPPSETPVNKASAAKDSEPEDSGTEEAVTEPDQALAESLAEPANEAEETDTAEEPETNTVVK